MGLFSKSKKNTPKTKGYSEAGASTIRRALKSFLAVSGSPNEDINWNNYTLRQRGRMLYMASPVATSALKTLRTKCVGVGLTLKSTVDRRVLGISAEAAKEWQRKTEAEFALWASKKENCDAIGMSNFECLQQIALLSWLMSGDVFVLIKRYEPTRNNPYTLRLHLIEADRVSTPDDSRGGALHLLNTDGKNVANGNRIYDGVEVDSNGRVVAYHIRDTYPGQYPAADAKWKRVEAFGEKTGLPNILHIMCAERPDQYRGVTFLAQVIEPLLQMRRYTESELMAALIQSFFSAWVKTEADPTDIPFNEVGAGDVDGLPSDNPDEGPDGISSDKNEYEMGPGTVNHLKIGEDIVFGNPTIPTSGFDNFTKTMCRLVGAALEEPHDVFMKDFNKSYSASRGALLEMWETIKMYRKWFIEDFPQLVYEIWLAEAIAIGRIKAPGYFVDPLLRDAWSDARWIGPVQGQIDPAKEVKAAIMNVDRGFKTHEQVTLEMGGGDWEENVEQLKRENEMLRDAGGGNFMASIDGNNDSGTNKGDGEED